MCGDRISKFLFKKGHHRILIIWIFLVILLILTSIYYGTFFRSNATSISMQIEILPLWKDIQFYFVLIVISIEFWLFIYFIKKAPEIFTDLWSNEVIFIKSTSINPIKIYNEELKDLETEINNERISLYGLIIGIIFIIPGLFFEYRNSIETPTILASHNIHSFPLTNSILYIVYFFFLFLFIIISFKFMSISKFILEINNKFKLKIRPTHPDKCGGFKPFGDFFIKYAYIILVFTLFMFIYIYFPQGSDPYNRDPVNRFIFFPSFLSLLIFFILYFSWPIHKIMLIQKKDFQNKLHNKLNPMYQKIIEKKFCTNIEESIELFRLETFYKNINKMSVWPFTIREKTISVIATCLTILYFLLTLFQTIKLNYFN